MSDGRKEHELKLIVIESTKVFVSLLGRNWLNILFPGWRNKIRSDWRSEMSVNRIGSK